MTQSHDESSAAAINPLQKAARQWVGALRQVDVWRSRPPSPNDLDQVKTGLRLQKELYEKQGYLLSLLSQATSREQDLRTVLPVDLQERVEDELERWSLLNFTQAPESAVSSVMVLCWSMWNDAPSDQEELIAAEDAAGLFDLWGRISEELDVIFARIMRESRLLGDTTQLSARAFPSMDLDAIDTMGLPAGDTQAWTEEQARARIHPEQGEWLRSGLVVMTFSAASYAMLAHAEEVVVSHMEEAMERLSTPRLRLGLSMDLDDGVLRAHQLRWNLFSEQLAQMIEDPSVASSRTLMWVSRDAKGVPRRLESMTILRDAQGEATAEIPAHCQIASEDWLWMALRPWIAIPDHRHALVIEQHPAPAADDQLPVTLPGDWFNVLPGSSTRH